MESTEIKDKKQRGRPKTGPIPVYCICINWDAKVAEKVYSPNGATREQIDEFSVEDAKKIFQENTGLEADLVFTSAYDKKGKTGKGSKKEDSEEVVTTPVSEISSLSNSLGMATFDQWKGLVFSIEGQEDIVFFLPTEDLIPGGKRNKPNAKPIQKSVLAFN